MTVCLLNDIDPLELSWKSFVKFWANHHLRSSVILRQGHALVDYAVDD